MQHTELPTTQHAARGNMKDNIKGLAQRYYDQFSKGYDDQRHLGYHRFLDESEVRITEPYLGQRVLEAGCGTGLVAERLSERCESMNGFDLSFGMLKKAKARVSRVSQAAITDLPFANDLFDTVVSFKVLAHIPDIERALSEMARVTKPGGYLVLEFYNKNSLRTVIKKIKPAHATSDSYSDEDMYTRYDSKADIQSYLPSNVKWIGAKGIRIFTPLASIANMPLIGPLTLSGERLATNTPVVSGLGGFLVAILQKQ